VGSDEKILLTETFEAALGEAVDALALLALTCGCCVLRFEPYLQS
jgi:hypothetical protein